MGSYVIFIGYPRQTNRLVTLVAQVQVWRACMLCHNYTSFVVVSVHKAFIL